MYMILDVTMLKMEVIMINLCYEMEAILMN